MNTAKTVRGATKTMQAAARTANAAKTIMRPQIPRTHEDQTALVARQHAWHAELGIGNGTPGHIQVTGYRNLHAKAGVVMPVL